MKQGVIVSFDRKRCSVLKKCEKQRNAEDMKNQAMYREFSFMHFEIMYDNKKKKKYRQWHHLNRFIEGTPQKRICNLWSSLGHGSHGKCKNSR